MSFAALLNQQATISRPAAATRASGTPVRHFDVVATSVPCAIQRRGGSVRQQDLGKVDASNWLGFFLVPSGVEKNDRVLCDGQTYEVTGVENLRGHHLEAELRTVTVV